MQSRWNSVDCFDQKCALFKEYQRNKRKVVQLSSGKEESTAAPVSFSISVQRDLLRTELTGDLIL